MDSSIPVVAPPQELTDASVGRFEALVGPYLAEPGPGLVLDLFEVSFINSAGLGSLVKIGMQLDREGRLLALARPGKRVERMLKLVGLDAKLPVFRSLDEASGHVVGSAARP